VWTDVDGRKMEAQLLRSSNHDIAQLRTRAGKVQKVATGRLSEADRQYVREKLAEQRQQ